MDATVAVGRYTYGFGPRTFWIYTPQERIRVGAFCAIRMDAMIFGGGEHSVSAPTTFPFRTLITRRGEANEDAYSKGPTRIGNDVMVGARAIVLSGVSVGDGAVIGAGAVVTRDVPPYAIVGGNPARVLRHRFAEDVIERLRRLAWWEWDDDELLPLAELLTTDLDGFLREGERRAREGVRRVEPAWRAVPAAVVEPHEWDDGLTDAAARRWQDRPS